jgi:hypothetical protein
LLVHFDRNVIDAKIGQPPAILIGRCDRDDVKSLALELRNEPASEVDNVPGRIDRDRGDRSRQGEFFLVI